MLWDGLFALRAQADDLLVGEQELTLAPGGKAAVVIKGTRLDYGARLKALRLRILGNPNTPHRCRCDRSFGQPVPGRVTPRCRASDPLPWAAE